MVPIWRDICLTPQPIWRTYCMVRYIVEMNDIMIIMIPGTGN